MCKRYTVSYGYILVRREEQESFWEKFLPQSPCNEVRTARLVDAWPAGTRRSRLSAL